MERKARNPFIVSWNHKRLKLSDGSHEKEFYDHDEALAFLESEMSKVKYEKSTPESKAEYRNKYGTEPTQGQLQCTCNYRRSIEQLIWWSSSKDDLLCQWRGSLLHRTGTSQNDGG